MLERWLSSRLLSGGLLPRENGGTGGVALSQTSTRTPGGLGYAEDVLLPVLQWRERGVFSLADDADFTRSMSAEAEGSAMGLGTSGEDRGHPIAAPTGTAGSASVNVAGSAGLFGQSSHRTSLLSSPSPARLDSMVPPLASPPPSPNLLGQPPSPSHSHSRRAVTPSSLKSVVSENEQVSAFDSRRDERLIIFLYFS